jgi:hypothetical protein
VIHTVCFLLRWLDGRVTLLVSRVDVHLTSIETDDSRTSFPLFELFTSTDGTSMASPTVLRDALELAPCDKKGKFRDTPLAYVLTSNHPS